MGTSRVEPQALLPGVIPARGQELLERLRPHVLLPVPRTLRRGPCSGPGATPQVAGMQGLCAFLARVLGLPHAVDKGAGVALAWRLSSVPGQRAQPA